jgi:Squalene-hopene cyclase C-terminal domain
LPPSEVARGRYFFTPFIFSKMKKSHSFVAVSAFILVAISATFQFKKGHLAPISSLTTPGFDAAYAPKTDAELFGEPTVSKIENSSNIDQKSQETAQKVLKNDIFNQKTVSDLFKTPKNIPNYLDKSVEWMVAAQQQNGGWGAGLNSRQEVRDPAAVAVDPATTAFACMALIRVGNTLSEGKYHKNLQKGLEYLLEAVAKTPDDAKNITTLSGTQIQSKLGQNVDVSMTSQFLSHVKPMAKSNDLDQKVTNSLKKCVKIIENAQQANGSWTASGWAPVLNSAMANSSLELAQSVGISVDTQKLQASQNYQASNISATGEVKAADGAGVTLYAASSAQRANGKNAQKVEKMLEDVKLPAAAAPAEVQKELEKRGVKKEKAREMSQNYDSYKSAAKQMTDESVLTGFGNNGGEEFLSYMMTSESYVTVGNQPDWDTWHKKMSNLFEKIQNQDGSWNGHHCITSPVFCTAAVVLVLTADRDALLATK